MIASDPGSLSSGATGPSVAVVGCGYWGKNLVRNFADLGALAAVSDPDPAVARAMADNHGVPARTWEALLADDTVKGVAIAAPAVLHAALATEALRAGKDLFVEKPLAVKVADGQALCDLARDEQRILMVGHLLQYHPVFRALKEMVDGGQLGALRHLYSNRLNFGKIRSEENVLWSFAPHDISMILALAGVVPDRVTAEGSAYVNPAIADVTTVHLGFPGALRARIQVSWLNPFKEQKLVVVGTQAMAVFDDRQAWRDKLVIYRHVIDRANGQVLARPAEGEAIEVAQDEPLKIECRQFLTAIETRKAPPTDGEEGLRVLQVLAAAQGALDHSMKDVVG